MSPSPPDYLRLRVDIRKDDAGGREVHSISPREGGNGKTVLYLHGGSYVMGFSRQHWRFLANLAEKSGARIVAPDYPLAPESGWGAAYRMLWDLYVKMTESADPRDIALMGDSAGGGLALGFAMLLRDERRPLPSSVVMLSPWLDITLENRNIREVDPSDPFLNIEALRKAGRVWARGSNPRKPLISPIYGSFSGLPPMHLFVGTKDIMISDCRKLNGLCMAEKVPLAYYEYENMLHVWMLMPMKEAGQALGQIAAIVRG